ncbi:hypothetical protein Scep_023321 [Stephania cephalantha]|uniref:PMI1/PMIR1-2 C-terminal domain-containing protein n=1 Tax=Stephania cephalantha TaxID=152367 RepID=A0AAP0EUG7_9MAGN
MATKSKSKSNKGTLLQPLIVSTDCSRLKSFHLACRRHCCNPKSSQVLPSKPISLKSSDNFRNVGAAQVYWAKANLLKLEIEELERLINNEKIRLEDCIADMSKMKLETKGTNSSTDERADLIRLANGYLYHMKVIDKPWGRLAIQVSTPAILSSEIEPNLSQVLRRMASMGTRDLNKWLLESMPMEDIHGKQVQETEMNSVCKGFGKGFMEGIVMASMEKMEILALEGLRIQMGRKEVTTNQMIFESSDGKTGESILLVMLVQLRDPENEYKNVGSLMVGLVEASVEEGSGFRIDGVHIAGISNDVDVNEKKKQQSRFMKPICLDDVKSLMRQRSGEKYLWSMSVKYCDGSCSFRCWDCVRNPDISISQ